MMILCRPLRAKPGLDVKQDMLFFLWGENRGRSAHSSYALAVTDMMHFANNASSVRVHEILERTGLVITMENMANKSTSCISC